MDAYEVPELPPPASTVGAIYPILQSSAGKSWSDLFVASYRLSPTPEILVTPEQQFTVASISLHLKGEPGELRVEFAGQKERAISCPGYLSLKPANIPTAASWDMTSVLLHVNLTFSLVTATAAEISKTDPVRLELIPRFNFQDPLMQHLCLALLDEVESGGRAGRLYAESLGHTLALHLLRHYASGAPVRPLPAHGLSDGQLRRVLDYVNDQLDQNLGLAELAAVAGFSPAHFARQFKEATGLAPHQYLIHRRVERARGLLETGLLTVTEVAHQVGFTDQSHLDRHFKRLLGVPPGTVLQASKNVQG